MCYLCIRLGVTHAPGGFIVPVKRGQIIMTKIIFVHLVNGTANSSLLGNYRHIFVLQRSTLLHFLNNNMPIVCTSYRLCADPANKGIRMVALEKFNWTIFFIVYISLYMCVYITFYMCIKLYV